MIEAAELSDAKAAAAVEDIFADINKTNIKQIDKNPMKSQRKSSTSINEWEYAIEAYKWMENGASIIGGCCGTTPNHIKELDKKSKKFLA